MPKPIIAEGSYPNLDCLSCDPYSVRILSSGYSSSSGELNAVLQYEYHAVHFSYNGDKHNAELLEGIAIAEMMHLKLLAEALIRLGASPVYTFNPPGQYNFYSTKFVSYSRTPRNMIEDDIMGEKYAIYCYERMLCKLKNDTLKSLICRILEDENLHLEILRKMLECYKC